MCDHSIETSLAVPSYDAICFLAFNKLKLKTFE